MPKEHPEDLISVFNTDFNCDEQDQENNYNHLDYFQVKWDGSPYRIKPGDTKLLPRYIAEHFAKHLITHLIEKEARSMDKTQGGKEKREKLKKEIFLDCLPYVEKIEEQKTEGEKVGELIKKINE